MSKRIVTLLFASSLLLGACASAEDGLTVEDKDEEIEEVQDESADEADEEETESAEDNRSTPVPFDKKVSQDFEFYGYNDGLTTEKYEGNRSITLTNFVRGEEVYDYLKEENPYNKEAPEGMEWAMIDVKYTINEAETEDKAQFLGPHFFIIDSSGSEIAQDKISPVIKNANVFGYVTLYSGGTLAGKHAFYIPKEEEVLIKFDDKNAEPILFDPTL